MTMRSFFLILCCGTLAGRLSSMGSALAADPRDVTLESIRERDALQTPTYTLKVTVEEPAHFIFRDQGNSLKSCTITQGPAGFAASCHADRLPKPVYHPPGTYEGPDYDDLGRLGVGMRASFVTLRTKEINETYEEVRVFYVGPQGEVVDAGVSRTLDRYPPDDRGRSSWSYNHLHRVWWTLGHGFSPHLVQLQGEVSESGKLHRMRVRGGFGDNSPVGVWQMGVETPPTRLVREATFLRDVDGQPVVEVVTKGTRQFDRVALAEEGSLRTSDGIETRVILQDFNSRFDEELFRKVTKAFEDLAGEEIQVVDYRADPKKPLRSTVRLPEGHLKDER